MADYRHLRKSHNVTLLLYHIVFPAKYRREVFTKEVDETIKNTCVEIEKKYEMKFREIGTDVDHIHLLVQGIPDMSLTKMIRIIKSITGREVFEKNPEVKKRLW
jgi:REP element-mobilizing transposase RayT